LSSLGQVGEAHQDVFQFLFGGREPGFRLHLLVRAGLDGRDGLRCVQAFALELADFRRSGVLGGFGGFDDVDQGTPQVVQLHQAVDRSFQAPAAPGFAKEFGIFADESRIDHGTRKGRLEAPSFRVGEAGTDSFGVVPGITCQIH
jgi:hypothetical protein